MKFNLVDGRDNSGSLEEDVQVVSGEVGNTNSLGLASGQSLLQSTVCDSKVTLDLLVEITSTICMAREERAFTGSQSNRPTKGEWQVLVKGLTGMSRKRGSLGSTYQCIR